MDLLVRTPRPFATESLLGFVLRVCELNGYESPRYVWELAEVPRGVELAPGLPVDGLAAILGQAPDELSRIAYRSNFEGRGTYKILGHSFGDDLRHTPLRLSKPALCPQCIVETGFLDAFWDLSVAVACPVHRCEVVRSCPACGDPLSWGRPGLLRCACGASLANARAAPASSGLCELMRVIQARLHGRPIDQAESAGGFPLAMLSPMPFSALIHLIIGLGEWVVRAEGAAPRAIPAVSEAASVLASWPHGFHRFLSQWGDKSLTERPGTLGYRKQFSGLFEAMFRNRTFSAHAGWLREEFLRFGQHHWGHATVDPRLLRGRASEPGRFLPVNEVARRYRIWKPMIRRMVADGTLVTKRVRSRSASRVVVDLQRSRLPQDSTGILIDREAARTLALPVSVLSQLRERGVFMTALRRGYVNSWHLDDVEVFRQRALALPLAGPRAGRAVVALRQLMRLAFRDRKVKADIVIAVLDGRLAVCGWDGVRPGDILLDRIDAEAFILKMRCKVAGDSYSVPQCARLTGLCETAVANAARMRLLATQEYRGRTRITAGSIDRFNSEWIPLATIAARLGSSSRELLRRCRRSCFPVVLVPRDGKRSPQPLLRRMFAQTLSEQWTAAKADRGSGVTRDVVQRLRRYLEGLATSGQQLPRRGIKPNLRAIAQACGFDRNALYKNKMAVRLLAEFDVGERQRLCNSLRSPLDRLREYLGRLRETGDQLPRWAGRPNQFAIARACGIHRHVFERCSGALALINGYAEQEREIANKAKPKAPHLPTVRTPLHTATH